jgi:hypothetical protein
MPCSAGDGPFTRRATVPRELIAMRAYSKWEKRGRPEGTHVRDWAEAERELQDQAVA